MHHSFYNENQLIQAHSITLTYTKPNTSW